MCGILVYLGQEKLGVNHPSLSVIAHRGPDGQGMQTFPLKDKILSLGHRRLKIIDLSDNAAQPMRYQDTELWITYNGEVYNYIELRKELQQDGYKFFTSSDTEVLLASYHKWGEGCLEKLNGMFSFAIWNNQSKTLFVARDRYGIKPLYYWKFSHGFAFVSEIKQLITLPGFEAVLNMDTAYQFLQFGDFCYDENTLWKNVLELEPGMMLQIDLKEWQPYDHITPKKWYNLAPHFDSAPVNESEAIEHFNYLLEDSIRLRLRSDVTVGFGLSGGLDSSSITCLAAKNIKQSSLLQTFSACCKESSCDETPFINIVLDAIDVESYKEFLEPSYVIDNMDFVTTKHDLPMTRMTIFSHHQLCQLSHSINTKVVLEGQGADEILAGYSGFSWAFLSELCLNFHVGTAISEYLYFRRNQRSSLAADVKKLLCTMFPNVFGIYQNRKTHIQQKETYFNFNVLGKSYMNQNPEIVRELSSVSELNRMRIVLLRAILHNVDRCSMAHSVEVRSPFLDYRLMEFCLALPTSLKIQKGLQKYILREAMTDILPAKIKERTDKMGFSSPVIQWARGPLKNFYRELLMELDEIPFINSHLVKEDFERFLKGSIPYNILFWRLICFQRWLKVFKISI